MKKASGYRSEHLGYDVNKLKLIGQGHQGKVYMLPNDKVLKVFYNSESCKKQLEVLLKAKDSRFFPSVYGFDNYSIIMSFVYGSRLSFYLKQNNINKHLSLELVRLIEELKRLGFTRLDARLGHIFLQPDDTVKVIDPRESYERKQPYPKSMLKGLQKHGDLMLFFEYIKHDYPEYYKYWRKMMYKEHRH
ncbi:serine/threonine protein kinase [Clostridium sp. SYSU_GA19001]|uniref:serine/threonine protein kinase n=1 Tax=Clostridium caldaquaticum TaxID=2940653 RepID=UPI002076D92F|nr:serine/threonine protein kinase [Clostridium caldaquaticum]MCM8711357.1 serine/threonine protein kinase [Clostridium caldaquaticum]